MAGGRGEVSLDCVKITACENQFDSGAEIVLKSLRVKRCAKCWRCSLNFVRLRNMRLLVFSDIHNNMDAVRALRKQEANEYDAVIVAGDIGSETAHEFFPLLDTFECPVFCVYGNWDGELNYSAELSTRCVLINHHIHSHGGYFFTGFSGCPSWWGNNPIYLEEQDAIDQKRRQVGQKHRQVISALDEAYAHADRYAAEHAAELDLPFEQLEEEFKQRRRRLLKRKTALGVNAHRRAGAKLRQWRDKMLDKLKQEREQKLNQPEVVAEMEKITSSREYDLYIEDLYDYSDRTFDRNRLTLLEQIKNSGVAQDRLIVITHERLFRFAEDGVVPLLHVFGHHHKFKHTYYRGTNYLNAAALDTFSFSGGGYCRVVLNDGQVEIERRHLPTNQRYRRQPMAPELNELIGPGSEVSPQSCSAG